MPETNSIAIALAGQTATGAWYRGRERRSAHSETIRDASSHLFDYIFERTGGRERNRFLVDPTAIRRGRRQVSRLPAVAERCDHQRPIRKPRPQFELKLLIMLRGHEYPSRAAQ